MNVELEFFASARDAVGTETMTREFASGTTVGDVLATLENEYSSLEELLHDDSEGLARHVTVLCNGEQLANLDGLTTELADGDKLSITPPRTGP